MELHVAEKFWPTGEPADSLRTLMSGLMLAAGWGNAEAARDAQRIWLKLTGVTDPATASRKGMSSKEIECKMKALMS